MSDEMLPVIANAGSYQVDEYENLSLVVILHCLNSFLRYSYVAFSLIICAAQGKPQHKCRLFSLIS